MKKIFYRVQRNDVLALISDNFCVSPFSIISENMLNKEVSEGDMLIISEKEHIYKPLPFETFYSVSKKTGVLEEELRRLNNVPYLFYGLTIRLK